MVQDVLLLETKQHELRNTVNRRKRKLQELYRVTCATANALIPRSVNNSQPTATKGTYVEADFLDANDLAKGRTFDATTLRRLPGAEPLFSPDGSYRGQAQPPTQSTSPPQPSANDQAQAKPSTESDNSALSSRPKSTTLDAPNGIKAGSRPRSPISPVEENGTTVATTSSNAAPTKPEDANSVAALKARTPATPPAEISDPAHPTQNGQDVATAAHEALKGQISGTEIQASASGPESQLLLEAAQSRTSPTDQQSISEPTHGAPKTIQSAEIPATSSKDVNPQVGTNGPLQGRTMAKPPMRIDTSVSRPGPVALQTANAAAATPPVSAVGSQISPPERMRTRVSSGAIRHKSVSEILGETPRTAHHDRTPSIDKTAFSPADSAAPSRRFSQATGTPDTATFKRRLSDLRGSQKDLSHQSMVVFARQQGQDDSTAKSLPKRGALQGVDDYLLPLFLAQASGHSTGLAQLLGQSRKSLTTANHHLEARELRDCRILKRIYTLQSTNKWSLRQPARSIEPDRPATQWDAILVEAKWMRTDFREERKWKHAQAKHLAYACADWVAASEAERQELQVKILKPAMKAAKTNGITPDATPNDNSQDESVPDLVPSNEDDTSEEADEDLRIVLSAPLPPAAVFSLGPEDLTFALGETPVSQKLLSELPMYNPFQDLQLRSRASADRSMDESWRKPITLVSKWNDGKIVFPEESPSKRRKVSRFDYDADPEPEDEPRKSLPPDQTDVAMFRPENRHIIQRLHASHAFRLPPMPIPSQEFFLQRQPSQWTRQEEDMLRRLVREYAFNWTLISSMLSSPSIYSSGAERRTPWECFERWEMLEGMPTEYARHEYYKRWHLRRSNAKQRHEEQYRQAQEQAQAGQQVQRIKRSGEPQTVDRRRGDKHIYTFQSMAKLAKKRESQLQKQQHMAAVAATRKANEPAQNANRRMRTPAEFSNHKHKQEQEMRQKIMDHRQGLAEKARAYSNGAARPPGAPAQGVPSVPQAGRGSVPSNGPVSQTQSSVQTGMTNGQNRLLPPGQGMMNANMANGARASPMTQTPMHYQQGQAGTSSNARVLAEANRVSEQQRLMQQTRQYPTMNGATQRNMGLSMSQTSNASFQNLQQQAGKLSPAVNVQRPMSSSSPRGSQAVPASQTPANGVTPMIDQIKNHIRTNHPGLTDTQVAEQATHQLSNILANQNSHGNTNNVYPTPSQQQGHQSQRSGSNIPMMQPNMSQQQQYAQALRMQMEQQQRGNGQMLAANRTGSSGNQSATRPESRGLVGTPQNRASTATPASSTVAGASQSPRPTSAQVANK